MSQSIYINSLKSAVQYLLSKHTYDKAEKVGEAQGVKGPICWILDLTFAGRVKRYYVFFKRDFLRSFKFIFNKPKEGFGQTINLNILKQAARDPLDPTLAIVMPPSTTYYIKAKHWMDYVAENNTVRTPSTEAGLEASIPARLLQVFDFYDE